MRPRSNPKPQIAPSMFKPPAFDSDSLELSKELTKGKTKDFSLLIDLEFSILLPFIKDTPLKT